MTSFEPVIGLEVHLQLSTATKIFYGTPIEFGANPNSCIDPLTLGLPGSLPVLNRNVVEYAIMMGLAVNCEIQRWNRFARKHYFYPDLPKGYQISQYEEPICEHGNINIFLQEGEKRIGITRIHMEEDAGKNIHDARTKASLVDLNRAGTPLLEIVSEPDIRSPEEATAYLKAIRQIARYLEISDGNMEEGSLRCDANVSIRPRGSETFGTRTEIKNVNSFKFVERALEYEIKRQQEVIESGGTVIQETRLFDSTTGETRAMRSKEESADYRYFPDPDLPPLEISEEWINNIREQMPLLPQEERKRFTESFGLSEYDAEVLTAEKAFVEYFEKTNKIADNPKACSNWITSELFGLLKKEGIEIEQCKITPQMLGTLISLIDSGAISGKIGKAIFEEMFKSGEDPKSIVEKKGLKQITKPEEIQKIVDQVFAENPEQAKNYAEGNERLHGYLVGQVMKLSKGNANPETTNKLIKKKVS